MIEEIGPFFRVFAFILDTRQRIQIHNSNNDKIEKRSSCSEWC